MTEIMHTVRIMRFVDRSDKTTAVLSLRVCYFSIGPIVITGHASSRISSGRIWRDEKKKKKYREKSRASITSMCLPLVPWCKLVCWESTTPPFPNSRDALYCPRKSCNRWYPEEGFSETDSGQARCHLKDKILTRVRERYLGISV